jgi:hypothetical protein
MRVWIGVYNYGLINEDVGVFGSLEEAKRAFREYMGLKGEGASVERLLLLFFYLNTYFISRHSFFFKTTYIISAFSF